MFAYGVASHCLTCGHFLISNRYANTILWGSPYRFINKFFALSWQTSVGCWMQSLTNSLASPLVLDKTCQSASWVNNLALHNLLKYWHEQYNMQLLSALSGLSPQNFSPKKFLIFSPKKNLFWKSFIYFLKQSSLLPSFQETELPYSLLKEVFPIFRERYIQNPSIFTTRGVIQNTAKHLRWSVLQK